MTIENQPGSARGEILVVDDNVSNLKYLAGILRQEGYQVRAANDGELALRSIGAKLPDIVLLDIQMPGMDGIEVCKRLKENSATSELPIIFLSAQDDTDIKVKALSVGGADYVTKPFQPFEILARIKTHLLIAENAAALKANEQRFRCIVESSPIAKYFYNLENDDRLILVGANPSADRIIGISHRDLIGKTIEEAFPQLVQTNLPSIYRKVAKGLLGNQTFEIPYKDERFSGYYNVTVFQAGANQIVVDFSEISERKQAELKLSESESRFRSVFEQSPVGSVFVGFDKRFIKCNPAFCTFLGYAENELIGKTISDVTYPEDVEIAMKQLMLVAEGKLDSFTVQKRYVRKDGLVVWGEVSISLVRDATGKPLYLLPIIKDITDRKKSEEEHLKYEQQLQQSQKLESLGLLAGGIAHDFNNLMGGIFGYIDMASEETKEVKVTSYLSKAMNTIDRARALTQQLLTFAKGGAPIQKIDHLFPFVEETAKFALSGANVSCDFDIPQDLWACNFDKNQIGQVIDNLIINAQQAMPVGGTIELTARNSTLAEKEHPLLQKGNYVKISIKDTGIGISKELIAKIFDPFFTTKAKGLGLGLATCYSIINRHGGCIDVESEQGKGSTFKVYLPASKEAASAAFKTTEKTHKGSGTFLIMDDEEVMRDTIGDMLESLGYKVISKENGKDSVGFFLSEIKENRKIDGIVFDLTIPGGMGGKDAIEEIRKVNREIPAFVASGYADDPVMKKPAEYGFTASISKPFRKFELTEMLNKHMKPKD